VVSDLGADELDSVELLMAVEEDFGISISDAEAEKLKTAGQYLDFVRQLTRNAPRLVSVRLIFQTVTGERLPGTTFVIDGGNSSASGKDGSATTRLTAGKHTIVFGLGRSRKKTQTLIVPATANYEELLVVDLEQDPREQIFLVPPEYVRKFLDAEKESTRAVDCGQPESMHCANAACIMQIAIRAAVAGSCDQAFELTLLVHCNDGKKQEAIRSAGRDAVCNYLKTGAPAAAE
jgi:hypothetical protein